MRSNFLPKKQLHIIVSRKISNWCLLLSKYSIYYVLGVAVLLEEKGSFRFKDQSVNICNVIKWHAKILKFLVFFFVFLFVFILILYHLINFVILIDYEKWVLIHIISRNVAGLQHHFYNSWERGGGEDYLFSHKNSSKHWNDFEVNKN